MLFNSEYDNSLLLILSGDNKNRELILKFIEELPKRLFDKIRNSLLKGKRSFSGEILEKKGLVYTYSMDIKTMELTIGKCLYRNNEYSNVFVISLFPYEDDKNLDVGKFYYLIRNDDYEYLSDCGKVEYSVINSSLGCFLKKYREYNPLIRTTFSKLNVNKEIDLFIDNVSLLSKKREKKSSK